MSLIRMAHPTLGELLVPDRKVAAYEADGWSRKRRRQPKTEQAEAPEKTSGAFSRPELESE